MNGDVAVKIKEYGEGEWRVFITGEIQGVKNAVHTFTDAVMSHAKAVNDVMQKQHEQELKLAEFPQNCPKGKDVAKLERRVDSLEKIEAGRKAVQTVLFGAGGVGIIGGVLAILKFIFEVI